MPEAYQEGLEGYGPEFDNAGDINALRDLLGGQQPVREDSWSEFSAAAISVFSGGFTCRYLQDSVENERVTKAFI